MKDWQDIQLADLVRFRNGKSTKGLEPGAYPVYGSNGIIGTGAQHMYENAIILGRVGAYCGSVEYCPGKFWATDNTIVVEPLEHLDTAFAAYMFRLANLNRYAGGSAQPLLTQTNLKGLSFSVPPVEAQLRIASILGAYDDLIEVNRRRIAVLEEMARGLFEEWFVRFRFPGHKEVPILDTQDGPLPEGWEFTPLSNLGTIVTGKTPSKTKTEFFDGPIPFVKIPDLHSSFFVHSSGESLSEEGAASQSNKSVPSGSLCVSCIGTIGLVAITAVPCQTNQQINTLIPSNSEWTEFLYFSLVRAKPTLVNLGANGATIGNVNKQKFSGVRLVCPSLELLRAFHERVEPMFMLVRNVEHANRRLTAARDLLLPRLISGQLSVSQAESAIEEAA